MNMYVIIDVFNIFFALLNYSCTKPPENDITTLKEFYPTIVSLKSHGDFQKYIYQILLY